MTEETVDRDIRLLKECIKLGKQAPKELDCKCGAMLFCEDFTPEGVILGKRTTAFEPGYFQNGRRKVCHAERGVIEKVMVEVFDLDKLVLYTSMEPCFNPNSNANGRSCAQLILDSGIKKVVFAYRDPNPSTDGFGHLYENGIEVLDYSSYEEFRGFPRWMLKLSDIDMKEISGGRHIPLEMFRKRLRERSGQDKPRGFFESDVLSSSQ